jgi:hypothetical protein
MVLAEAMSPPSNSHSPDHLSFPTVEFTDMQPCCPTVFRKSHQQNLKGVPVFVNIRFRQSELGNIWMTVLIDLITMLLYAMKAEHCR